MRIVDLHCDVLMKIFQNRSISFIDSRQLDVNATLLKKANSKLQFFAVYIPEDVHPSLRFEAALSMISLFYEKIIALPYFTLITNKQDYDSLEEDKMGAVLSLEGCDCIQGDWTKLQTLVKLGVSAVGLTWNYANEFADGALEPRNAGLSIKGRQLVQWLKEEQLLLDVSHISEASFWDCLEIGGTIFASHSNCKKICNHLRNLSDAQIGALLKRNALIGITFVPFFLTTKKEATILDIVKHVDHIFSLGGVQNVAFGSDFDGIKQYVKDLQSYGDYPYLIEILLKHFSYEQVQGLVHQNFEKRVLLS